jgi:hypothetical protein
MISVNLVAIGTYLAVALAAWGTGMVTSIATSYVLTVLYVAPGHGRVVVNAILLRMIMSMGVNQPGLGLLKIVAALVVAGVCVWLISSLLVTFVVACVVSAVLAIGAMIVVGHTA